MRRPGAETVVPAEEMLRLDLRAILFNDRWIEAMKAEGRHGAGRMAGLTGKVLGWKINRPGSVDDGVFDEIVDVYIRDRKHLRLAEFFEVESPRALQALTRNLLEAARKGLWATDQATLRQVAATHADSVARHGRHIDGNVPLEAFVQATLSATGEPGDVELASDYAEAQALGSGPQVPAPGSPEVTDALPVAHARTAAAAPVRGSELTPVGQRETEQDGGSSGGMLAMGTAVLLLSLGVAGAVLRKGAA
jgi:cobalamin biosynthesis Mg chelatase CobN